jgi:hypothetical protein
MRGKRLVRFDGTYLYLKVGEQESKLGFITTRKGRLTREQKIKAVAARGEWVKL